MWNCAFSISCFMPKSKWKCYPIRYGQSNLKLWPNPLKWMMVDLILRTSAHELHLKKSVHFSFGRIRMHPVHIITFIWLMSIQPWILFIYFDFAQFFPVFLSLSILKGVFGQLNTYFFCLSLFLLGFLSCSLCLWLVFYSNNNLFASQPCIIHKWTWARCLRSSSTLGMNRFCTDDLNRQNILSFSCDKW